MFRVVRLAQYASEGQERAGAAWRAVNTQPGWIVKATVFAFLLVVGVPVVLLLLLALLVAGLLFAVLWGANALVRRLKGLMPQRDGRENVRVIRRIDGP
jgi:hypothetical protein